MIIKIISKQSDGQFNITEAEVDNIPNGKIIGFSVCGNCPPKAKVEQVDDPVEEKLKQPAKKTSTKK